jgi:hypothetical protein
MSKKPLDHMKDILLEDHKHYSEWLHRNEESGEKRANLYITLLAAIPTVIVAIAEKNDLHVFENGNLQIIFSMVLFALLFFGYFTFLRLIKRNSVTDEMKFALDKIRQQPMDIFDTSSYLTYRKPPNYVKSNTLSSLLLSEFTSFEFTEWCRLKIINITYIQPGRPMQNALVCVQKTNLLMSV